MLLMAAIHQQSTLAYQTNAPAGSSRRAFLNQATAATFASGFIILAPNQANAAFTPGGTLVDREVGVTVGNSEASARRAVDNTNVLFTQDYYFKFGTAAPWIDDSNRLEFPATMPFTRTQQRYDALQKYGSRVAAGLQAVAVDLVQPIQSGHYADIAPADSPIYALRALGLLANNMIASENTGTTNELLLARWYVNELYLAIGDIKAAASFEEAKKAHKSAVKAANSYLNMMNRVISPKVGDPFKLFQI